MTAIQPRIAVVPVERSHDIASMVSWIWAEAKSRRNLAFDLGVWACDEGLDEIIAKLASLRTETHTALTFSIGLRGLPNWRQFGAMGKAGIFKVSLQPDPPAAADGASALLLNAMQLDAVRMAASFDLEIEWHWIAANRSATLWQPAPETLLHLPPPVSARGDGFPSDDAHFGENGPSGNPASTIQHQLESWRRSYRPRTLSFSRGPGFVRVFDRRKGRNHWRFIVLEGIQAELFDRCSPILKVSEIAASLRIEDVAKVTLFFDRLAVEGIAVRIFEERFVLLPVAKSMRERWASGDY